MLYIKSISTFILTVITLLTLYSAASGQFSNRVIFQNQYDQGDPFIALHPTNPSIQAVTYYTNLTSVYTIYPGFAITTNGGTTWTTGNRPFPTGLQ